MFERGYSSSTPQGFRVIAAEEGVTIVEDGKEAMAERGFDIADDDWDDSRMARRTSTGHHFYRS